MKRGTLVSGLLLWCLSLAANSQAPPAEVTLTVWSMPSSQVFLRTATGESYLGVSGQPLHFRPPALLAPDGQVAQYVQRRAGA
ncbi:MAG: hypothetical protein U0931_14115 [Vulcanimicrobiota bacterium]